MYISEQDKTRILEVANNHLLEVVVTNSAIKKKGNNYVGKCPVCENEKSFNYKIKDNFFKCFACDFAGNNPVAFWMKQGKNYPETLKLLAEQFNIIIDVEPVQPKPVTKKHAGKSYCDRMLAESGLTRKDVESKIFVKDENRTTLAGKTFKSGTVNSRNEIVDGDDVIIEYYDLEGAPVTYEYFHKSQKTASKKEYFRVRWQFPEEHLDKNGKPFKYKSPAGSGSFIYIPQRIRDMYHSGKEIPRLFIQEGEKKAEKACKHDIPSVAISGIHNLGRNGVLHEDLVKLIVACKVKELVLLFDADLYDLSRNISINDNVTQRPRSFFIAAKNFQEYGKQLINSRSIYLEMYIGHVIPNPAKDKGIDDLLVNTLKDKEDELKKDIDFLINERSLSGKYLQLHKITAWSDARLMDLWSLNNSKDFAERYKDILKELPEFRIDKYRWRFNEDGEIESAQPFESYEQFWEEITRQTRQGDLYTKYEFRYEPCLKFLYNRGYGRLLGQNGKSYSFIHVQHPFVSTIYQHEDIRDFVKNFVREIRKDEVLELLHKGGVQYLGPQRLSDLPYIKPNFEESRRDRQLFYFKDGYWIVTEDSVEEKDYSTITHQIWRDNVHDIAAKRTERLINVGKYGDNFTYSLSKSGKECHFLQFLINASNFTWRKDSSTISEQEINDNITHLISKLCAIGFMMMSAKDKAVAKILVAMDGKQSEVGASNGRSGKSLLGNLFEEVMPTVYINGKSKDIDGDQFLWSEMNEKTKIVFIDDVRTNFSMEFLFGLTTGNWAINKKGESKVTLSFNESPKLYLTTNHAINGEGSSYRDRQWIIAFSDFYNDEHRPPDDFGGYFFEDWDFDQWNLTWNLLAECVQLYLRFGVVEAPGERIRQRQLRQAMGELFISWAEEYFSSDEKLNERLLRKDVYDAFNDYAPDQRRFNTPHSFKKKLNLYCEWKGLLFNPHMYDIVSGLPMKYDKDGRPDDRDTSGGIEYIMIGEPDRWQAVAESKSFPFTENEEKEF